MSAPNNDGGFSPRPELNVMREAGVEKSTPVFFWQLSTSFRQVLPKAIRRLRIE
jgi:hypothetical protein